ncbi:MAG: hypothetical protein P8X42_02000 [Calditrichaceae bacterium]
MKKIMLLAPFLSGLIFITFACNKAQDHIQRMDNGLIESDKINEASGIDQSWLNDNVFWLHNDSGNEAQIFAIDERGKNLGRFKLANIKNRDWEDIAVGPGPIDGQSYIYIGEIGDNRAEYEDKYIYRVKEPVIDSTHTPYNAIIENIDIISFIYPDGPRDAETVMIDPLTKDIIIVSKREENVHVYSLAYPQPMDSVIIAQRITILPITQVTGGDISNTGDKIVLKNYEKIYYWTRKSGETLADAFSKEPQLLPYIPEPQGEAICWDKEGKDYFTVSEEAEKTQARLYSYPFK